jgi:hypothetical protein
MGAVHPDDSWTRAELASATAAAVVSAGRDRENAELSRFVTLADEVGLQTLSELWRDADAGTLASSLWALYLLRTWCNTDADGVARLWRAGRPYAPADEVVAGVADDADPSAVGALADAVLGGAYDGDFAVALERAASFFRVIAAGRRAVAGDDVGRGESDGDEGTEGRRRADRNDRVADGLAGAAIAWRAGTLT